MSLLVIFGVDYYANLQMNVATCLRQMLLGKSLSFLIVLGASIFFGMWTITWALNFVLQVESNIRKWRSGSS
jgi:hypothetical protein